MKRNKLWMLAAILFCGTTTILTSCADENDNPAPEDPVEKMKEDIRAKYGENKKITDGNYDKSIAVKCINGTFVGKKTGNVITYKGIPFVGEQPTGKNRFKAPVAYTANDDGGRPQG